ncbi:hypothetical protein GCM10011492_12460 [Flexivirga endophytica]|uniref:Type II toxin-antitoxin system RelE/ParE family toxin n=1 Tax=Flexivirga endophytica TaxID=1849103 RepID=A0A916SZ24_9MICO|nr:hypothetical protein GCM10011492_12460 [Flexivirga endophytica]GHB62709.1 hypothetical protein GCM10008112_34580 [Flexivirga endophytica]
MTVALGEHAVADLRRARDHYARIDPALSHNFADAFDMVVSRIRAFPHGAPPVEGFPGLRRARMRRFPYGVFYRDAPDQDPVILVVRVLHSSRDASRHLDH